MDKKTRPIHVVVGALWHITYQSQCEFIKGFLEFETTRGVLREIDFTILSYVIISTISLDKHGTLASTT